MFVVDRGWPAWDPPLEADELRLLRAEFGCSREKDSALEVAVCLVVDPALADTPRCCLAVAEEVAG